PLHFSNQNINSQTLEEALNSSPLIMEIMRRKGTGCIILEEPKELEELIRKTGAVETGETGDINTLKNHSNWNIRDNNVQIDHEPLQDIYQDLKEALRNG
ncbi:MAG: hypothetical protein ACE5HY_06320, partial [Candidatus Hydrothermarchaeales archaeon]